MRHDAEISPFLWFDNNAEEAARFYCSIFKNSKIEDVTRYGGERPGPKGRAMSVTFQLEGQEFYALNGGPQFKFAEAVSLFISCKRQQEVDRYWSKLTEGGEESPSRWLKDKFGLSWQVVPTVLGQMLADKDPARAGRVMEAMLKMRKIDIGALKAAYKG